MSKEANKLAEEILKHKIKYYQGEAEITDQEYDALEERLRKIAPKHKVLHIVGAPVANEKTHLHGVFMGSLNNVNGEREFKRWYVQLRKVYKGPLHLSTKMDGTSVELIYKKGWLRKALTRGDGKVGQNITRHVLCMHSVPKQAGDFTGSVKCEFVLHHDDFIQV